jgi:hypothetical protein
MELSGHLHSPVELLLQKKPDVYKIGGWVGPTTNLKLLKRAKLVASSRLQTNNAVTFFYFAIFFYLMARFGCFSSFDVLRMMSPETEIFWDIRLRRVVNS